MEITGLLHRELRDAVWARAWESGLTSPQLLVTLRLVEHWPNIFPGIDTLARWTQLGSSTVRRVLKELEAARVIRIEPDPGRVNRYHLLDRNGVIIPYGCPDVGPAPLGASGPPRSERAHPPLGASGPTPIGASAEADPDLKQETKREGEARARDLSTHGSQPVLRYRFRSDWKPHEAHRTRGLELGLTDRDILERAEDCLRKPIKQGFLDEDDHFYRELAWALRDRETRRAKEQAYANRESVETPGSRRARG